MERFRARSKPINGSSNNNISGADRTVLARATRRVSPPDNTDGYSDNKDSSSKTEIISSRGIAFGARFFENSRFCNTLKCGNKRPS